MITDKFLSFAAAAALATTTGIFLSAPASAQEQGFEQADQNGDGVIDEQEYYTATQGGHILIHDRNEDGVLDENEWLDAMNQLPTGADIEAGEADVGGDAGAQVGADAAEAEAGGADAGDTGASDAGAGDADAGDAGAGDAGTGVD